MRLGLGSFADDHNKALQEPVAGYKARSVNDSSEVKFARDVDAVMFYITRAPSPPSFHLFGILADQNNPPAISVVGSKIPIMIFPGLSGFPRGLRPGVSILERVCIAY